MLSFLRRREPAPTDEEMGSLLVKSAMVGHLQSVRDMLRCGADINSTEEGMTALQIAAANGHDDVVEFLLSAGADHSHRDDHGGGALHSACINGTPRTVELLLKAGANPDARDKN